MKKKFIFIVFMFMVVFTLVACNKTEALTAITFSGTNDVTLEFKEAFNVLDGVKATGNDGKDYSDKITYSHVEKTVITNDILDSTKTGQHAIKYEVKVDGILAQKFRMITVKEPAAVEGQMLVNADFAQGTTGWDSPKVVYTEGDAKITITTEDGALKVDVIAGGQAYIPRFGQMGVPFEQGKTYEVSFKAKSSAEKTINLQVGELLDGAPYFTDFKKGITVYEVITTEWATHSYKFTMNLDNKRGGILFELGNVGGNQVDATLWFDDVTIEEATPDADETAPVFSGLSAEKSVLLNSTFNPLAGVTAFDIVDDDVTEDIVLVIKNSSMAVVAEVDTTVEGTYTLTYTVSDSAGNEAEFVVTLEVVGIQFSDANLVANPTFDTALTVDKPEWAMWTQDWGSAPVVVAGIDTAKGEYTVDITGGGDAAWAVQLSQEGYINLVEGKTYRLTVTVKAEAARKINIALGYGDPWVGYARFDAVEVGLTDTVIELLFTVTKETHDVKLVFELGTQDGFADGLVTFSDVKLQEALLDDILMNSQMGDGFTVWQQDWNDFPTVTVDRVGGMFNITTDKSGEAGYSVQFNQYLDLEAEKTYVLSFDAKALAARDINVKLFVPDIWVFYVEQVDHMLTTEMATYTFEFTTGAENFAGLTLSFELGKTTNFVATTVSLDNISLKEKNVAEAKENIINGDATTVPYFTYDNSGGGEGNMVLGVDGAVVTVTTMGAAYQPHLYQFIDSLAPGKYILKIVLDSTVDRDLRTNITLPDAGYTSILPDSFVDLEVLSTETNVFYVEFTVANEITNVKVELDFGDLGTGLTSLVGVFTVHEILIYQDLN